MTHWESSKSPLFVKTIWQDGQHHVILGKNEAGKRNNNKRRAYSCISSKKSFVTQKTHHQDVILKQHFQVPTIKLLVMGGDCFNNSDSCLTDRKSNCFQRYVDTIDIIPGDSLKFKNMNSEVSFNNEINNNPTKNESCMIDNNNLSDRVLIWLDLASQQQQNDNSVIVTPAVQKRIVSSKYLKKNDNFNRNYRLDSGFVLKKNEVLVKRRDLSPVLMTCQLECGKVEKLISDEMQINRGNKRQEVHIFVPNVPKKSVESSLISSGSFKKL